LTLSELKKDVSFSNGMKKGQLVNSLYSDFLSWFQCGESFSWTMYSETEEQARKKLFDSITSEKFEAWKAERVAARQAKQKAIDNPQTIEDFRTFIAYKGEGALSTEQRATLDMLLTDRRRDEQTEREKREAVIEAVSLDDVQMILKESFHTKKNIPLWVVQLSNRVDRIKWNELDQKAHKLGGYYSGYSKNGAIPGFTFDNEEGAKMFMQLQGGKVDASEVIAERKAERVLSRTETMREKAQRMEDEANESLNQCRKTNTHRRAMIAGSVERAALGNIEFAQTFRAIAEGIDLGEINYLDPLSTFTQLDELQSILSAAKWRYIRKKEIRESEYEYSPEVIEFSKMPYPVLYRDHVSKLLIELREKPGKKLVASRMLKRLNLKKEIESIVINGPKGLADYEKLFCDKTYTTDRYLMERLADQKKRLDRLTRMGIENIFMLRTALRELVSIKDKIQLSPEVKKMQQIRELERKFINSTIPGFFPTPIELAKNVVDLAEIKEGNTIAETSAGLGHIAEVIAEAHPDNELTCIEINGSLCEVLSLKGFDVLNEDFFTFTGKFDRIIMNPPFENLQDIDHVIHGFSLLNPGGRLVAIMAHNKRGYRGRIPELNDLIDRYGYSQENPAGSFISAFKTTGVSTITVVLDKPY
jgi:hypothetical protein